MAAQPASATAGAATSAGAGSDTRRYWGRAGRAALWNDINVDEYEPGMRCQRQSIHRLLLAPVL